MKVFLTLTDKHLSIKEISEICHQNAPYQVLGKCISVGQCVCALLTLMGLPEAAGKGGCS